jgi:hypothetical protein
MTPASSTATAPGSRSSASVARPPSPHGSVGEAQRAAGTSVPLPEYWPATVVHASVRRRRPERQEPVVALVRHQDGVRGRVVGQALGRVEAARCALDRVDAAVRADDADAGPEVLGEVHAAVLVDGHAADVAQPGLGGGLAVAALGARGGRRGTARPSRRRGPCGSRRGSPRPACRRTRAARRRPLAPRRRSSRTRPRRSCRPGWPRPRADARRCRRDDRDRPGGSGRRGLRHACREESRAQRGGARPQGPSAACSCHDFPVLSLLTMPRVRARNRSRYGRIRSMRGAFSPAREWTYRRSRTRTVSRRTVPSAVATRTSV